MKNFNIRELNSLNFKANESKPQKRTLNNLNIIAKGNTNAELFDVVYGKFRGPKETVVLKGGESIQIQKGLYYSVKNKKDKDVRLGIDVYGN